MSKPKLNIEHLDVSKKSKAILDNTLKNMGFIPNMYTKMAGNTSTLDSYTYAYDSFRKNSGFTPVEQEVIFLSVSYFNNCEYCMAAHSFVGDEMSNVPKEVTEALRNDEMVPDAKLYALSIFTKTMVEKRGWADQNDLTDFFKAGYDESHVLGVITGIAVKTLSNYSNHLTQPEIDEAFANRKWVKD
jgi:uncharacterized peroxidase-related enzyme